MSPLDSLRRAVRVTFWNADRRRLRAPWRLALFALGSVVLSFGVGYGLALAPAGALRWLQAASAPLRRFVTTALSAATTTLAVYLAGRFLDRRPFEDFGLGIDRDWWIDLGFGLALGAGLMTLVFGVELALGWVRVADTVRADGRLGFLPAAALVLGTFLLVGFYEELLARGYLLTNVAEGLARFGRAVAVVAATVVSSAVFGLLHAGNPSATALSTLAVGLAGVLLAFGYLLTDELAVPIGLHVAWNFFQGVVYGFPVSGLDVGTSLFVVEQRGPTLVTGGSFGPEAGLIGWAAMAVGCLAVVAWVRVRHGAVSLAPIERPTLRRG